MTEQEIVDYFARLAKPRLLELLRLKVQHIYDPSPGQVDSIFIDGTSVIRMKLKSTVQPYASIERFVAEDKSMGFVINPGLVPLVKAISLDVRGRYLLVTRKVGDRQSDEGVISHLEGFGARLRMSHVAGQNDTHLTWECLYGVA